MWERDSEGGALGPHVTVIKKNRPLAPKLTVECKIIIGFSSEDAAAAADGQLSFACRHVQAARGGCGKGSVGLPLAVLALCDHDRAPPQKDWRDQRIF